MIKIQDNEGHKDYQRARKILRRCFIIKAFYMFQKLFIFS